jgi:NAD(P)-dependent dehydrogenase (short-subunit alcohol dehydrogenase family)
VVLADSKEEAVRKASEKLVNKGHPLRCQQRRSDRSHGRAAVAEFDRFDVSINNASVMAKISPTADSTLEEFDRVTHVNLRGVWSCMKLYALPPLD